MQEDKKMSREEAISFYTDDVLKLDKYLRWLNENSGTNASSLYKKDGLSDSSMTFPVYDSTLLSFIKVIKTSKFINPNYVYTYSSLRIRTAEDELETIERCTLQEIGVLGDILSKYALKGEVKGTVWSEGLKSGVYLAIVKQLKKVIGIK